MNTIDTILFDLGNVILPFNHYQIAERLSRFTQGKDNLTPPEIFSYLFDLEKGTINDFETGKMSPMEFFLSLKKFLQLSISFEEFKPIWNDIFWENLEVSEIIRTIKEKKRLGLLSNTNLLHFDYVLKKFSIVEVFDRWILSHEVGFKKPAVQIFEKALEWASADPNNILFIDDMKHHVEVACSLGMHGIHFTSAHQLKEELVKKFALSISQT